MIDFPKRSQEPNAAFTKKGNRREPTLEEKVLVHSLFDRSIAYYTPAKTLREYIMGDQASALEHMGFEECNPETPIKLGEVTDRIIIDWLNRDISPEIAAARISPLIQEVRDFYAANEINLAECDENFLSSAIALRDEIFVSEAERTKALSALAAVRRAYGVSSQDQNR